ncbi:hypothetical protein [Legionella quinlivanii]|uniref:hypothetical protein n=1 Tax=Legionella quinlivanii TaxID=45073 RepID=UPI001559CF59|nr:hypothetical protein [Legionella quinlivanii]
MTDESILPGASTILAANKSTLPYQEISLLLDHPMDTPDKPQQVNLHAHSRQAKNI